MRLLTRILAAAGSIITVCAAVAAAQGGKGVLWVQKHINGYYTIAAASFGLQAGVQWFSYALFFMDPQLGFGHFWRGGALVS